MNFLQFVWKRKKVTLSLSKKQDARRKRDIFSKFGEKISLNIGLYK